MSHPHNTAAVTRFTHVIGILIVFVFMCTPGLLTAADESGADALDVSVETLTQLKSRLHKSGYSNDEIGSVVQTLANAEQKGIPARILLGRVQEGVAKDIAADRLIFALRSDIKNLEQARLIFNELENGSLLLAATARWQRAANMLAAGVAPEELAALGRVCIPFPEKFRPASVLYASLMNWGLASDTTFSVVQALIKSELSVAEYEGILNLYSSARRSRVSPEEVSRRIITESEKAADIEELKHRILR